MGEALVLRPLALDSDSYSSRGSFLADRPPILGDEIFKAPSSSDSSNVESCPHADTKILAPLSRQSSSARDSSTSSRIFLSLSASTHNFFEQHRGGGTGASAYYSDINMESSFFDCNELCPGTTDFPAQFDINTPIKKDDLPEEHKATVKYQAEDLSKSDGTQEMLQTPVVLLSEGVLSHMAYVTSSKGSQLSFTTRSLNFSRKSIITTKQNNIEVLDEATMSRMKKRRDLIEELLQSEEIYISELKTLLNVYFGPVNDAIYPLTERKASFIRTISGILDLHERLYQAMHNAIPRTFDTRQGSWSIERQLSQLLSPFDLSNPAAAALVSNAFDETMKDLLVYEDFISKYDGILKDGHIFRSNPRKRSWERDCELLANSFLSKSCKPDLTRRALTFEDLLMKPIQRICKYPLFFTELLRVTPVIDCPESNAILDRVNTRFKTVVCQLDMIKDNSSKVRDKLERNWLLQKRLNFKDKLGPQPVQLGQAVLCGPLYAIWRDSKAVHGDYYACLLYKSYLLLAAVSKSDSSLNVVLAVSLITARIEDSSQGTGIQCHNVPFSWIVGFEHDFLAYEVILCAWNSREEDVWRKSMEERIALENRDWMCDGSPTLRTLFVRPIACDIEPSRTRSAHGYQSSLRRHWSFHGSITGSVKVGPLIVSVQNTWAPSEQPVSQSRIRSAAGLNRSSSVINVNDVFALSPKRSTRSRLENALMDVWSKDLLPIGVSNWLLGPRKFSMGNIPSMASITSSFGRKASQAFIDAQSPIKGNDESLMLEITDVVKSDKRRSNSFEHTKIRGDEPPTPVKESSPKEPKTPTSPIWANWGGLKGKETSNTLNSPTLWGDKGTCRKKKWRSSGNVKRFFECDLSLNTTMGDKKNGIL